VPQDGRPAPKSPGDGARRRRLSAPERRELIMKAALRAFATHGYDAASMEQIASAAGVSKAVVYDHVASKRELYTELVASIWIQLQTAVDAALAPVEQRGEARVRTAMAAFFEFVEQQPEACRLLLFEIHGANVSDFGRELEERIAASIIETLGGDARLFEGHPHRARQVAILAEIVKSATHGLASWWFRHPEVPAEDLVERSTGVIWPALARAGGES
jgi:AcrR family transcriptional regulator